MKHEHPVDMAGKGIHKGLPCIRPLRMASRLPVRRNPSNRSSLCCEPARTQIGNIAVAVQSVQSLRLQKLQLGRRIEAYDAGVSILSGVRKWDQHQHPIRQESVKKRVDWSVVIEKPELPSTLLELLSGKGWADRPRTNTLPWWMCLI